MDLNKKILVIGGNGFIGGNFVKISYKKGLLPIIADLNYREELKDYEFYNLDITDENEVLKIFKNVNPAVAINFASVADIDLAERQKDVAYKINVTGACNIARVCKLLKVNYIFISSDAVFDGEGESYSEDSIPSPINYYGFTKFEAEKCITEIIAGAIIIRLSLVLGFAIAGGNSFLSAIGEKIKCGKKIFVPRDEIRTPIDVYTLCECIIKLLEIKYSGLIHVGSCESISRYELTRMIIKKFGFNPEDYICEITSKQQLVDRAPRHRNGIINVSKCQRVLNLKMPSISECIERAFAEQRFN